MMKVFVDANILYAQTTRDWLYAFSTCEACPFDLYSSQMVFAEVIYRFGRKHPEISGESITRLVMKMQSLVKLIDEYDSTQAKESYLGNDPHDLHVHAAALYGRCDILLTNDIRLYGNATEEQLDALPYSVYTADDFFCSLAEESAIYLDQAVTCELHYWSHKYPEGGFDLQQSLAQAGCPKFGYLVKRALMRKSGLNPAIIDKVMPLCDDYSPIMRSNAFNDLDSISDDFL